MNRSDFILELSKLTEDKKITWHPIEIFKSNIEMGDGYYMITKSGLKITVFDFYSNSNLHFELIITKELKLLHSFKEEYGLDDLLYKIQNSILNYEALLIDCVLE